MKARRKHHKVEQLPPALKARVDDGLCRGETFRAIASDVTAKGQPISHAAIGRYGADFLARLERIRVVNDQAKAIIEQTEGAPLRMEEAATQLGLGLMTEALLKLQDLEGADPVEIVNALARLQSSSVQRERLRIQWRDEQRARAKEAAAEVAGKARAGGLSDEVIREIEERILGIPG